MYSAALAFNSNSFFFLCVDKYDLFFSGYLFKKQKSYLCVNFSQVCLKYNI